MQAWLWASLWLACTRSRDRAAGHVWWQHVRVAALPGIAARVRTQRSGTFAEAMQRVVTPLGFELCPLDIRQVRGCLISLLVNASINVGVSAASDDRPSRSVALCGLVFICLRWGQGLNESSCSRGSPRWNSSCQEESASVGPSLKQLTREDVR